MVTELLCAGLLAMSSSPGIANRFAEIEAKTGGKIGVSALDAANGQQIEYRANERFPMCSTFKMLAAAAVLQRVDDGKERLDRFVSYTNADILEYAPVTKKHLGEGGMRLSELCAAAIEQSDNTAANLLLVSLGGPSSVTAFARTLGDKTTRLDRTEPELNHWSPGDKRDTTSPSAMRHDWVQLLTKNVLSAHSRELLESWLRASETGTGMIRAAVPKDWQVGDKTGRNLNGALNDVAILRPQNRAPIFLAIYTRESTAPSDKCIAAIAEAARITIEHLSPNEKSTP